MVPKRPVLESIYSTFGEVAKTLGYSPIHGKIIAALTANQNDMSLQELAAETGYSISMVSLSLDLLEMMGIIRKYRKQGNRNLYISLQADLLGTLKNAIVTRISKSIASTLKDLDSVKKGIDKLPRGEKERSERSISVLEREIKRLEGYVRILSEVRLP